MFFFADSLVETVSKSFSSHLAYVLRRNTECVFCRAEIRLSSWNMSNLPLIRRSAVMWNEFHIQDGSDKRVEANNVNISACAQLSLLYSVYAFCSKMQVIITRKYSSCSTFLEWNWRFSACCGLGLLKFHVIPLCALIAREAAAQRLQETRSIKSSLKHIITLFMHQRKCQQLIIK